MIVIGTNAYADINEYNNLINTRFMSNNPIRKYWESLSNSDKESLIIGSTLKYDNETMLYKGVKQSSEQSLQFPRIINNSDILECPDNIKLGIILQGCNDSMIEGTTEGEMLANGVKSFADGTGARIEFIDSSSSKGSAVRTSNGIIRDIWIHYFAQYSLMV